MTTASVTPQATPSGDSFETIQRKLTAANAELADLRSAIDKETTSLAALRAQYDDHCRGLALGRKAADPAGVRSKMNQCESRIEGLQAVLKEKQAAAAPIMEEYSRAAQERVRREEQEHEAALLSQIADADRRVEAAQAALNDAVERRIRIGNELQAHRSARSERELRERSARVAHKVR